VSPTIAAVKSEGIGCKIGDRKNLVKKNAELVAIYVDMLPLNASSDF